MPSGAGGWSGGAAPCPHAPSCFADGDTPAAGRAPGPVCLLACRALRIFRQRCSLINKHPAQHIVSCLPVLAIRAPLRRPQGSLVWDLVSPAVRVGHTRASAKQIHVSGPTCGHAPIGTAWPLQVCLQTCQERVEAGLVPWNSCPSAERPQAPLHCIGDGCSGSSLRARPVDPHSQGRLLQEQRAGTVPQPPPSLLGPSYSPSPAHGLQGVRIWA